MKTTGIKSLRKRIEMFPHGIVIVIIITGFVMPIIQDGNVVVNLLTGWRFPLAYIGFVLIYIGWERRVGKSEHCRNCEYERHPSHVTAKCPECGFSWCQPYGTIRGKRAKSYVTIAVGIVLIVFPLSSFIFWNMHSKLDHTMLKLAPTTSLIDHVTHDGVNVAYDAWDAIESRALSATEEEQLFLGLLEKHGQDEKNGHMFYSAEKWMKGYVGKESTSDELRERYEVLMKK